MPVVPLPKRGMLMRNWIRSAQAGSRHLANVSGSDVALSAGADGIQSRVIAPFIRWDAVPFGYRKSGVTFTVLAGEIQFGNVVISVAETDVTIAADETWVMLRCPWVGLAADIVSGTSKLASDETYWYRWLYRVRLAGSQVWPDQFGHFAFDAPTRNVTSFQAIRRSNKATIQMESGDIWFLPVAIGASGTIIEWASITYNPGSGALATPAVTPTDPCVFLVITVAEGSEAATMHVGSKAEMKNTGAALISAADAMTKLIWPLVETTWLANEISKVKNLWSGDIVIYR